LETKASIHARENSCISKIKDSLSIEKKKIKTMMLVFFNIRGNMCHHIRRELAILHSKIQEGREES
jgi:hypothetical protein